MSAVFDAYAAYYDLLYRGKDYTGEARYVQRHLERYAPQARALLELGCGTGAHALPLAGMGYSVHGIDQSNRMLASAQQLVTAQAPDVGARLSFGQGDIRDWRAGHTFDAVLSLFHVFSYQTSDEDVGAAFRTAAAHLRPGGLLIVDFWHGPAVEAIGPEARERTFHEEGLRVTRVVRPDWNRRLHRVDVHYDVHVEDLARGERARFEETHAMRYFFREELEAFLAEAGLGAVAWREWMTENEPTTDSWSAMLIATRHP